MYKKQGSLKLRTYFSVLQSKIFLSKTFTLKDIKNMISKYLF